MQKKIFHRIKIRWKEKFYDENPILPEKMIDIDQSYGFKYWGFVIIFEKKLRASSSQNPI